MTKVKDIEDNPKGTYEESLPAKCYEDALAILGETKSLRHDHIQKIQRWITENPQINAHNHPKTIIFFLRGCKFDLEKTKLKIKRCVFLGLCKCDLRLNVYTETKGVTELNNTHIRRLRAYLISRYSPIYFQLL